MSIQVNIFNSGSVPTATELANFISELNTDLDSIVTLNTEQIIEGAKTFWGSKMLKFKQKTTADKLGFTFYDNQGKEVGNFEYDNKNNFRLLALGNYYSAANQEIEGHVGFKVFNKSASSAYRLICPLAGNAKNSIPSLSETYTNFYMPLIFTNGALSVTTDNNGKVDLSTLIGSGGGGGDISGLATVATTGDYNDLLNRPILFSGNYNDLSNKPTLFSGSYGDLTDKPTLFSGDYTDLTNKPTIPVNLSDLTSDSTHRLVTDALISSWNSKSDFSGSYNDLTDKPSIPSAQVNSDWNSSSGVSQILNKPNLATVATSGSYNDLNDKPTIPTIPTIPDSLSDLSDDSTHRLVTDTEKTTWNNKSDFSGSYNDLTDKPTIPTVPTISTNITNDAASDTKTTSPKAVKDFVEGKGYLTQHQDISGKANQTDLEALEDRVETLEQDGGSTPTYSYLKLIDDLDAYLNTAQVGEVDMYSGITNGKYTKGWVYEKMSSAVTQTISFYDSAGDTTRKQCPFTYVEQVNGLFGNVYNGNQAMLLFNTSPAVGDKVVYWDANNANPTVTSITSLAEGGFYIGTSTYYSLNDFGVCRLSKFTGSNSYICYVMGEAEDLTANVIPPLHDRFYFYNGTYKGMCSNNIGYTGIFVERENFDVNVATGSIYITSINQSGYQGPFYYTGKNNIYTVAKYYDEFDNLAAFGWGPAGYIYIGDTVYKTSGSTVTSTTTVKSIGNKIKFNNDSLEYTVTMFLNTQLYEFANANGDLIYVDSKVLGNSSSSWQANVFVPATQETFVTTVDTATTTAPVSFSIGTPSVYWRPIVMPTENNGGGVNVITADLQNWTIDKTATELAAMANEMLSTGKPVYLKTGNDVKPLSLSLDTSDYGSTYFYTESTQIVNTSPKYIATIRTYIIIDDAIIDSEQRNELPIS